jgi:uncharacterized membrane protein
MTGWLEYTAAFAAFFFSHSVPVRPRIRARLVAVLGPRGFTLAYSLLSLGVLAWLIGAAGRAPFVPLWAWAPWQDLVALAAMAVVCAMLALALGRPNPFSFGGANNDRFDPRRPGIVRLTRHPLLLALTLWAFAHMLANGDAAHVILFGAFGAFALLGRRIIDRRRRHDMGEDWNRILSEVGRASRGASIAGTPYLVPRMAAALALYAGLLWGHPWLFGVSPLPG